MMSKPSYQALEKRIEELESLLQANEAKNNRLTQTFVASLSHEIRTPLNAIVGFANLISSGHAGTLKRKEYSIHISRNTERLLYIIDSLIDLALLESCNLKLEYSECNVEEIIYNLYQNYNLEKHRLKRTEIAVLYNCAIEKSQGMIYADQLRLQMVLSNLLNNAIKFTEKGVIEFGCVREDNVIQFFVKDSGIGGLEPGDESIFLPFVKLCDSPFSGNDGLGIGLTIGKGIVELMGGHIWFEPNTYNGTTFYFTIPVIIPPVSDSLERNMLVYDEKRVLNQN